MENIFIASFVRKKKKKNFSNVSLKTWCAGAVNLIRKKITLDSSGAQSFCRLFFSSFSFLFFFYEIPVAEIVRLRSQNVLNEDRDLPPSLYRITSLFSQDNKVEIRR